MKYADIQRLHEAGLISDEQRQKIIAQFGLKEEGGKFLAILSMVGAVLIATGIALLVASHWNEIGRGVKIGVGIALMIGAHALGWWLREVHGEYRKSGEALHFLGSSLFLANIALLGQIYNFVSRSPNALLAWWIGIAALPWLLRSRAQYILLLLAFGVWFGCEVNQSDSWIYCQNGEQILLYCALGALYVGKGWLLRRGAFEEFADPSEKLGMLIFLGCAYPLSWKEFFGPMSADVHRWTFPAMAAVATVVLALGAKNLSALSRQWRWTWFGAIAGMLVFMATVWFGLWLFEPRAGWASSHYWGDTWSYAPGALVLFVFCLLQIQVGIQERSSFLVNLGIIFIALDIFAAYVDLFGSMARTGVMFVIGGAFLIGFGVYLEKKRRKLMQRMRVSPSAA